MGCKIVVHRELSHSEEQKDHKYVARVKTGSTKKGDTYRYFYTNAEYQAYLKNQKAAEEKKSTDKKSFSLNSLFKSVSDSFAKASEKNKKAVDKFFDDVGIAIENKVRDIPNVMNKVVDKVTEIAEDLYEDEDNIFDVKPTSYDTKITKIAETDEWKAIVARKDPEYTKQNEDGTTTYLIDDYLAKKKQPILDVIDDISNFRPITVNEIEKDAVVAGIKEKIFGTLALGAMAVGVASKALIEKTKISQGSYNDEIEQLKDDLTNTMNAGKDYVNTIMDVKDTVTSDDVQSTMKLIQNNSDKISEATKVVNELNENNVIAAAKIILTSDNLPDSLKNDATFAQAESIMSSLTDEEIALLSTLLSTVTGSR